MNALATAAPPLTSVIVPCFNECDFTKLCFDALVRHTRPAWELIVVDNGSTDGTPEFLREFKDRSAIPVEIVSNPRNAGFPAACNQGLSAAYGDYLVLLNNDTVPTDAWLDQLIALVDSDPAIGIVGPMSNYVRPAQLVERVPYADLNAMHQFARNWRTEHRGQWFYVERLSGFCMLMKRRVYEAVGNFDLSFGPGLYDDDDYSLRALRAGFRLAVARDLFVHHSGSRGFKSAGIDIDALMRENGQRFAAKWGAAIATNGTALAAQSSSIASNASPRPRPRVSLTMIVRNEEANLPTCLGSVEGVFDEIVIMDTGSTDRTREIAREFGARVFEMPWVDDFAAARNAALARARGDYAFYVDGDDVFDPPERDKLRTLLAGLQQSDDAAYVVRCACDPDSNGGGGHTVVDHVRLFPLREEVRWSYRVHEQILPSLRRCGIPVRWSDVTVRHTGYTDPVLRRRKLLRDEAILRAELEEQPNEPFALFNLGSIALEREDWRTALEHLRASLSGSAPTDSITLKLFALIARCHQMLGEPELAISACRAGLQIDSDDAELLFRQAVVHRNTGDRPAAEACWRRVLSVRRPDRFISIDSGIYGHLTRRNLAALAVERNDPGEAIKLWNEVLTECPGDHDATCALSRLRELPTPSPPQATVQRFQPPSKPPQLFNWLIPGSRRETLTASSDDEYEPFAPIVAAWVSILDANVVVELGVRFGESSRALLAGLGNADAHVWGVDPLNRHDVDDTRFTYVQADPATVFDQWETIDLLHIDVDPNSRDLPIHWAELFGPKCRAIVFCDTHHPHYGTSAAAQRLVASGPWRAFEYRDGRIGWIVLTRPGEPSPYRDQDRSGANASDQHEEVTR
jgi:glycosyltransferase involved in cell wall biosynthesis